MALVNTYTISKTTSNEENSDSIIDSINDVQNPNINRKYAKARNYRREHSGLGIKYITTTEAKRFKPHKTMKRRCGGFWRKIKFKNKHKTTIPINGNESVNLVYNNIPDGNDDVINDDIREKRSENYNVDSDQDGMTKDATVAPKYKRALNKTVTDLKPYQKYINGAVKNVTEKKAYTLDYKDTKSLIAKITSGVTDLNLFEHEKKKFTPKNIKMQSIYTTQLPYVEESELSTAQIEALLNEIKERAIQMVSEINPSLSNLITNTVTETTFEADPLLKKIAFTTPGFMFSTFVSINDAFDKRTINDIDLTMNDTETNTLSSHKIDSRSLKEDGMTIAQTIEDYLQKELKSWYKKVKDTVGKDVQKAVKHHKSTIKNECRNEAKKPTSGTHTNAMSKPTKSTKKSKPIVRSNRGDSAKSKKFTTCSTSTVDDYILLTLYEQILAKTHEDNVMKMVTMPAIHYNIKKRNEDLISKRNLETLADLKLNDDLRKIYDEDVMVPEAYDFSSDINVDVSSPSNDYSEEIRDQVTTEQIVTDTSYEGLTNKLSYNDYVNGYKYYLKYQKDEANTNFSNLVKYQAHKHHSVDDIGKFILNKIPQVSTSRREKRAKNKIFDDNDFDDQEVSTRTDDSWFKKHFYMFVDNGPTKKFHTSQTIAFKSPTGEAGTKKNLSNTNKVLEERHVDLRNKNEADKSSPEVNLDELSKYLQSNLLLADKIEATLATKIDSTANSKNSQSSFQNLPMIKELQLNIGKIFGKGRKTLNTTDKSGEKANDYKENNDLNDVDDQDMEEGFDMTMINNLNSVNEKDFELGRVRRNSKKSFKPHRKVEDFKKSTANNRNDAGKNKKNGYVNIDLVPTQIVTLRDKKESRLKKLLNVFRRKNNKVYKRDNQRVQRFNPLKKIKDIFLSKSEDKLNNKPLSDLDYELLTTRLTGFKPYKFDRVQTLEDIKKQIPDITDYLQEKTNIDEMINDYDIKKSISDVTEVTTDNFMVYTDYNMNDNFSDIVESQLRANMKSIVDSADFSTANSISTPSTFTFSTFTTKQKSTAFPIIKYKYRDNTSKDNLLNINILENITTPEIKTTNVSRVTVEAINKDSDNLREKVTLNSNYYNRPYIQKHDIPTPTINRLHELVNDDEKISANKGIIIGKKETRITTFHYKPKQKGEPIDIVTVLESPRLYEDVYETYGLPKGSVEVKNEIKNDNLFNINNSVNNIDLSSNMNNNMEKSKVDKKELQNFISVLPTKLTSITPGFDDGKTFKPSPDYFNDLLMWNHDILSYDRVPQLHNLIHSDLVTEYLIPNVQDIRKELNDLEEAIASYYPNENRDENNNVVTKLFDLPPIKNNSMPKATKNDLIRRVAINDDAMGPINEIFIKGEAKYFRYDKKPAESAEEFVKTIDVVNRVHNFNSKDDFPKKTARKDDNYNFIDSKRSNDVSLPVDSTLFSYDDDVDFVTLYLAPKKLSKNSLRPIKRLHNRTMIKPITKINKTPKQHFSTPLPMRMDNFEKFLKENDLDVPSVTSPLMELPSLATNIPLPKKHAENHKIKDTFHNDNSTKVLDKKLETFGAKKNSYEAKESNINKFKPKSIRNNIEANFEDLERLHRELFTDPESLIVKRDTNSQDNNYYDLEKDLDNIKLFETVEGD